MYCPLKFIISKSYPDFNGRCVLNGIVQVCDFLSFRILSVTPYIFVNSVLLSLG